MFNVSRIKASIITRFVQPWIQNHFELTQYGKTISSYRDKYKGKRCFLIGNGPSLKAEDLEKLYENDEITFAFNRIYNIFDKTNWRPTFYISQDEKMLKGCEDAVNSIDLPIKFIPIQLKWHYDINIDGATYFNMVWQSDDVSSQIEFSDNLSKMVFCSSTGMYTAAQLASYMGFTEIYLIGVDHHFQISQNNKGEIIVDNSVKDYFSENYNKDKENLYIPNTEKSTLTYIAMRNHCSQRGIKVFNATHGGKLEVFPRVCFDDIFNE